MGLFKNVLLLVLFAFVLNTANANTDWVNSGKAYLSSSEFDRALDSFNKALEANPNEIEAYIYLAKIHTFRGQYQKAMDSYNRALEINPDLIKVVLKKRKLEQKQNAPDTQEFGDQLPDPEIVQTKPDPINLPQRKR